MKEIEEIRPSPALRWPHGSARSSTRPIFETNGFVTALQGAEFSMISRETMTLRTSLFIAAGFAALFAAAPAAMAQADSAASLAKPIAKGDSIAGRWQANLGISGGTKYFKLSIAQFGDSLSAIAHVEVNDTSGDDTYEMIGSIHDRKIELRARFVDGVRMTGTLRGETLRMRVVPGRYQEAATYEISFRPAP
ncbi:MAG: hypothetical protein ABIY52_13695 [Gemmatimonadaceae bacterium]